MRQFFDNIWTKRFFSLFSGAYAAAAIYVCYCSIFYNIEVASVLSLALFVSGVSLLALIIMLYTRRQFLTKLASVLIVPSMLPVVLLYFGEWELIIPVIATGIIILLLSGAGEGFKTAFGTIFLLMYIFGALGYFLFTSFFVSSSETSVVASGFSQSQLYRYSVVNTQDSSNGSTAVYVEPNYADKHYPFVTFTLKDIAHVVHLERPINETIDIQWTTQTRQEITAELNSISDSIAVHLSEADLKKLGYSYDSKLILTNITSDEKVMCGRGAADIETIYLDQLTPEQLSYFGIGKDASSRYYVIEPSAELVEDYGDDGTVFFSEMDADSQSEYNVEKEDSVMLNTLTDEDLAMLGVPESGDVMTFNGKICFRYYVAILEDYFDVDSRSFSISLLN